jgi:energy-coupling factor transporter ATP-binding protein EcfA2
MLIEFSISNFRSFREKQTFSMVAAPRLKKGDNVFKPVVKGEKLPDLLKVAAIYGPNASGKSNLIKALGIVSDIASRQPSAQAMSLPVSPFRFDPQLADKPSRIELHFVYAGQRYEFNLALTQQRIIEERLLAFPKGKETLLYERRHLSFGDEYTFGLQLEGGEDLHELWKKTTGPQVLFLVQAVANSSEELKQLREPLTWLQTGFMIVSGSMNIWADSSQKLAEDIPSFAKEISSFLQDVDVPVTNIRFDQMEHNSTSSLLGGLLRSVDSKPKSKTILTHKTVLGEAEFDFQEESEGTKNLIGFWLPWSIRGQSSFSKQNRTLVVDELDSSLHPEIVVSLVAKHLKSDSPAQLIFTTHDTHLMDAKLLRRDQFWLTERDANGATQLRSIHDFEGRESEDMEKRYFEGRYRGLPFVRKG